MKSKIIKIGTSKGIVIPSLEIISHKLKVGDIIDIEINDHIKPIKSNQNRFIVK